MSQDEKPLRHEGVSLYHQLYLVLREQIVRGAVEPGAGLPTEQALCERYGVSRITVRRALSALAAQGYVERRHGLGTFARQRQAQMAPVPALTMVGALRKAQLETTAKVIEVADRPPPTLVAAALQLAEDETARYVLRVRGDQRQPLMTTESWLPARFASVVTPSALRKHALYELLLSTGVKLGRVVQEVTALTAEPFYADLLDVQIGSPLLCMTRLVNDVHGVPVQHLTVKATPSRSRFLMEIPAADIDSASAGFIAHDIAPSVARSRRPTQRPPRG